MSTAAHANQPASQDTPVELLELKKAIDALPANHRLSLLPAFHRVVETTTRRRKILQLVQEALGQLRLDMKYLVFDLEATRRERDTYKAQVQHLSGGDDSNDESAE